MLVRTAVVAMTTFSIAGRAAVLTCLASQTHFSQHTGAHPSTMNKHARCISAHTLALLYRKIITLLTQRNHALFTYRAIFRVQIFLIFYQKVIRQKIFAFYLFYLLISNLLDYLKRSF